MLWMSMHLSCLFEKYWAYLTLWRSAGHRPCISHHLNLYHIIFVKNYKPRNTIYVVCEDNNVKIGRVSIYFDIDGADWSSVLIRQLHLLSSIALSIVATYFLYSRDSENQSYFVEKKSFIVYTDQTNSGHALVSASTRVRTPDVTSTWRGSAAK